MKILLLFNGEASSSTLVENLVTHDYDKIKYKSKNKN
jgi:hypothetical protein